MSGAMLVDELDDEEVRLVALLADGLTFGSVARRANMSERTLRRRVHAMCERIGVRSPIQLVVWAVRSGIL